MNWTQEARAPIFWLVKNWAMTYVIVAEVFRLLHDFIRR